MGVAEASPGELPGTDRIPTRQDTLKTELNIGAEFLRRRVVEGGCSCRQLFPTRSSSEQQMLLISQQKVRGVCQEGSQSDEMGVKRASGRGGGRRTGPFPEMLDDRGGT